MVFLENQLSGVITHFNWDMHRKIPLTIIEPMLAVMFLKRNKDFIKLPKRRLLNILSKVCRC